MASSGCAREVPSAVTGCTRAFGGVFLINSYWGLPSFLQSSLFAAQMLPSKRESMIYVLKYVKDAVVFLLSKGFQLLSHW